MKQLIQYLNWSIVILSLTSSLVISVVVIAFVVCHRTFRSKGRQSSLRRRSTASTRRPATSYYEIDDCAIALDTLSCRQSNVDMYMNLDKTKVERSKYATLTQRPGKKWLIFEIKKKTKQSMPVVRRCYFSCKRTY